MNYNIMDYNFEYLRQALPHRYPFLLIDKVLNMDVENSEVLCLKNLTINEEFFQGHFPSKPVMPGVLMIEAMAQASILISAECIKSRANIPDEIARKAIFLLTGVDDAKFKNIAQPGDALRIKSKLSGYKGIGGGKFFVKNNCTITIGETLCASCVISSFFEI